MMNSGTIKGLSFILVLQIILVVSFSFLGTDDLAVFSSEQPILEFDKGSVDELIIKGLESDISLVKNEDSWQIPSENNFPADAKKVNDFIEKAQSTTKSWPIAQSKSAMSSLKVSDESYERKISFNSGNKELAVLYMGTSPGLKKVHARAGGDKVVYSIEMTTLDAPTEVNEWADKEFLYTDKENIKNINLPEVGIVSESGEFTVDNLSSSEKVNDSEINSVVSQVSMLRYVELLGTTPPDGYEELEITTSFELVLNDDQTKQFVARGPFEESFYILTQKSVPFYFKVSKGLIDKLTTLDRSNLVSTESGDSEGENSLAQEQDAEEDQ